MGVRLAMLSFAAAASCGLATQRAPHPSWLFDGTSSVELTLTAPLTDLFAHDADEHETVRGSLSYRDPSSGTSVVLPDIRVSVRGHTSRRESECSFPKLRIKLPTSASAPMPFTGMAGFKIGTHCGEAPPDTLTPNFGRLANETSPPREALTYRILDTAGVPTLRTRPARIRYVDQGRGTGDRGPGIGDGGRGTRDRGSGLVRNALLLEDEDAARERMHAVSDVPMETFGNVQTRGATADAVRIAFGEAMIGNFDWCLRFFPGDRYRCDNLKPLWNVLAFQGANGRTALVAADFDLAGIVVGRHQWFSKVYNAGFLPSRSAIAIEVMSQVQRTRSLFDRAVLDAERRRLLARKRDVFAAIDAAPVDARGRDLARAYVTAFFDDISSDAEFYRPVVTKLNVQVYADTDRVHEACGPRDAIPVGTPVNEVQHTTSMTHVLVLDALWRWSPPHQCKAVQTGPVWIESDAVSRDYPTR